MLIALLTPKSLMCSMCPWCEAQADLMLRDGCSMPIVEGVDCHAFAVRRDPTHIVPCGRCGADTCACPCPYDACLPWGFCVQNGLLYNGLHSTVLEFAARCVNVLERRVGMRCHW